MLGPPSPTMVQAYQLVSIRCRMNGGIVSVCYLDGSLLRWRSRSAVRRVAWYPVTIDAQAMTLPSLRENRMARNTRNSTLKVSLVSFQNPRPGPNLEPERIGIGMLTVAVPPVYQVRELAPFVVDATYESSHKKTYT